ncbi:MULTISPECIES: head GIN domain-containing protein [unclassified Flavobacterium]|uniref:head GIN domain-containing protein n=1 Tax=unclassified Flavobacterium TaxID=196869 RepID=UPI001F1341D2|nr:MULTISPECIES: head GIN domain-containing protein [unclassified Flavobacterium]UMY66370.1 DUF2807 domain-containing protein [Flavobacterium sp. HJ-32-4]
MKRIHLLFALLSLPAFSQEISREVGAFDKVSAFDQIDVLLIPSDENKVILNGKEAEKVEIVNKNGELKIRMPLGRLLAGDAISATVFYTKLEAVEANEGSRIACEKAVETTLFEVEAKEGGEVRMVLNVGKLNVKASGGARVSLDGTATNQEVIVNSGAEYNASKLVTGQTVVTANAGGNADVNASELVEAKVRAGGNIRIFGHPRRVEEKTVIGGTIVRMD